MKIELESKSYDRMRYTVRIGDLVRYATHLEIHGGGGGNGKVGRKGNFGKGCDVPHGVIMGEMEERA